MDHSGHGMMMDLPPFTLGRGLAWSADPFFLTTCLLGLVLYVWGVVRLVRRGDAWPVGRTVAFVLGAMMQVFGMVSFELFGHTKGVIDDGEDFYLGRLIALADGLGLP